MSLNPGIRVTVKLREGYEFQGHRDSSTTGEIVSPAEPRTKAGMHGLVNEILLNIL